VRRHDKGAAGLVVDEGMDPDERIASAVLSAEGAERDLTDDESDDLGALTGNLCDANSAAWHPCAATSMTGTASSTSISTKPTRRAWTSSHAAFPT
jgi:hypothetical protein